MANNSEQPKRIGITAGELFFGCLTVVGAILSFWISTSTRLSALELRVTATEKSNEIINLKLDKLQDGVSEIKVSLQNKADRKP